jgi:hypothetical protein
VEPSAREQEGIISSRETRNGGADHLWFAPPFLCATIVGGRSFLTAMEHSGDQEWSPSRCATRDLGGRAFLRAVLKYA